MYASSSDERWFDQFSVQPREMWRDVRLGWRRLRLAPGFTAFSIITLALGLGMTTAAYSAMYDYLWRPLGVPGSDAIVTVRMNKYPLESVPLSWPDFRDLQTLPRTFDKLAAFGPVYSSLAANGRAELVTGQAVSGEFFQVFTASPAMGRLIQPADDQPGAPAVVVLAHATWRKQLGLDPTIVGKTVKLGEQTFTVIGVAPPSFRGTFPTRPQAFWVPLTSAPGLAKWLGYRNDSTNRASAWLTVAGRLRPSIAIDTASAGVEGLSK